MAGDVVHHPHKKETCPIEIRDLVLVLTGPFKGRWLRVVSIMEDGWHIGLRLRYTDDDKESLAEAKKHGALTEESEDEAVPVIESRDGIQVRRIEKRKKLKESVHLRALAFRSNSLNNLLS